MSKGKFKKTALHSGIGDGHDLLVKPPEREDAKEEFKIAARARGKRKNTAEVYPRVDFQYGVHYKGQTVETYHEEPFEFDVPAYPKRVLEYDIEERRFLCYDRFWEIQADFEATVMRMTMEYAIEYTVLEEVKDPVNFRLKWSGTFEKDPLSYFNNNNDNFIGNHNPDAYKFDPNTGRLRDMLNRNEFSGVLADKDALPDTTVNINMSLEFRPLPSIGLGTILESDIPKHERWYFQNNSYSTISAMPTSRFKFEDGPYAGKYGHRDDDVVGFVFKAKKSSTGLNGYIFLWESESRVMSGRRVKKLDNFRITHNTIVDNATGSDGDPVDGTFAHTDFRTQYVSSAGNPTYADIMSPTHSTNITKFKNWHVNRGWGKKHQRIYKVTNNVLTEVYATDLPGWEFNKWHKVKININGKNVKIHTSINGGAERLSYEFTSEFEEGTVGLCNMSQAVEYKNLVLEQIGNTGGYMPADGSYVPAESDGQFHANAADYIKPSLQAHAAAEGINVSEIDVKSIKVEFENGDSKGTTITLPPAPFNGPINVTLGTRLDGYTKRIPEDPNEWFTWDGIGDLTVAEEGLDYILDNSDPPGQSQWGEGKYQIIDITGVVKEDPSAAYDLPWSPKAENVTGWFDNPINQYGPIVLHSNNPTDADAVYDATYYKCGFATICPDHLSKETGNIVVSDSNLLFAAEIAQFFNRNTYINKKRVYTLIYPVWTEQMQEILEAGKDPVLSLGGCVIEPGKDPVLSDLIPCRPEKDDFFWDGSQLIMWTCEPPVEYKTVSYSHGIYAFEGEVKRVHSEDFEPPNPWTTYRLIPIVETIENNFDYVKWVGTDALEWIQPYTPVGLRTLRYFIPDWSGEWEGKNAGIVTSEEDLMFDIPPIPEKYLDPITMTEMPYGYSDFVFLLESPKGFNEQTKLRLWWLSNPAFHTKNVDTSPTNVNKLNGTYILRALNMADKIVVHCDENPIYTDWVSGKHMGYGKLNGQGTLQCDDSGKADMTNVPTDVVYFPENFVPESLDGPYIDVYVDEEKYPGAEVTWHLSSDKKLVHFTTDYKGSHIWYTDWMSQWAQYDQSFTIDNSGVVSLGKLEDFTISTDGEDLKDIIVEKLEVTNDNPFVLTWSGDLTNDQMKEMSGNIDAIDMNAIKDSWVQFDTSSTAKGDWDFITHDGIEMITNKVNQDGRSMWYNTTHQNMEDYGVRINVKVEDTVDDDMIGVVFRFNPVTEEHYAVEWDAGGTTASGLRLVRYNKDSSGTNFLAPAILAREAGFYWNRDREYSIMIKGKGNNIKVYVDNILKFNVEDDSLNALKKGAWGPMNYSQPLTYFWDLQMFELQESPEVFAKIKDSRPYNWSPMIHNGYYYLEDKEHYLYAEKIIHKVTPNINNEIIISPRPEQGSAIIVQDNNGRNLRKVMFHDDHYQPTLRNKEVFSGNGNAAYYLSYMGVDESSLIVTVNGATEAFIFDDTKSRIEFMRKMTEEDTIQVYYRVLYSYMIDMNFDVPGNRAKITLHDKYDPSDMMDMTVTYESASETPFYRANDIVFNPILNHNHAGFLFITDEKQKVKDVSINISPRTLEVNHARKVLITAKAVDEFGNPAVGKEVKLFRNGIEQLSFSNNLTNSAGEVYFYYTPITSAADIPSSYVDEYEVRCEGKRDVGVLNYYEPGNMDRRYIDIQLSKEAVIGGSSDNVEAIITLRDKDFRRLSGEKVRVEITHTNGTKNATDYIVPSNKQIKINIVGTGQRQGYVYIKATHDMGVEDAVTLKAIKVLGG